MMQLSEFAKRALLMRKGRWNPFVYDRGKSAVHFDEIDVQVADGVVTIEFRWKNKPIGGMEVPRRIVEAADIMHVTVRDVHGTLNLDVK